MLVVRLPVPEANTIYDTDGNIVITAKFGSILSRLKEGIIGKYDYGDEGQIRNCEGEPVASFKDSIVRGINGEEIGSYAPVPWEEFDGKPHPTRPEATIKKLVVGGKTVGWCIGNAGSAAGAIALHFVEQRS